MSSFMKDNDVHIKDGNDVNSVMRDMMSIILDPRNRHGEYEPKLIKKYQNP